MKATRHGVPQLDGLRFIAALLVMISHSTFNHRVIPDPLLNFIWASAAVGLALFFVLSGFVIHYGYHQTVTLRGGPTAFAIARFARLYPLYLLIVLYEVLTSGGVASPEKTVSLLFVGTLTQSWWYGLLGSNNLLFQWGDSTAVAWSISAELAMYMLYPALCIAVHRLRSLRANVLLIASICLGQLLLCFLVVRYEGSVLRYYQIVFGPVVNASSATGSADDFFQWLESFSPLLRFGQFALGVAIGNVFIRREQFKMRSLLHPLARVAPGLVLLTMLGFWIVNSFYIYPLMHSFVSYHGVVTYLGIFSIFSAALIYVVASVPEAATARFFGSALMTRAGDATYATYLLHVPLLGFVHQRVVNLAIAGAPPGEAVLRAFYLLVTYAFIVVVGYAVFRGFEAPARRWIRRHCASVAIYAIIATQLCCFVVGVATVTCVQRHSCTGLGKFWPSRAAVVNPSVAIGSRLLLGSVGAGG